MPRTGGAYSLYGLYGVEDGKVVYAEGQGGYIGRMVSVKITKTNNSDNDWNCDNSVGETDDAFGGGQIALEVGEISLETAEAVLGVEVVPLTGGNAIEGVTDEGACKIIHKANPQIPYIGVGTVMEERIHGVTYYTPIIVNKVKLQPPDTEIATRKPNKNIDWGNVTANGTIFKDDADEPNWKTECSPLTTMAQALAFLRAILGVPDPASEEETEETQGQTNG